MNSKESFKVLIGNHIIGIGQPIAVVTGIEADQRVAAEIYYTFIEPSSKPLEKTNIKHYSAPLTKDGGETVFGIEELWSGFVDQDLRNVIYHHSIFPIFEKNQELYKIHSYTNPITLIQTDRSSLYYFKKNTLVSRN